MQKRTKKIVCTIIVVLIILIFVLVQFIDCSLFWGFQIQFDEAVHSSASFTPSSSSSTLLPSEAAESIGSLESTNKETCHVHSYIHCITLPTCTEYGYTTYTCACGDSYQDSYTEATGHSWDSGKVTVEPTCTAEGVKTYTCSCGDQYTEPIPKAAHSYTSKVTAPSCTKKGYTTHTCVCGDSYRDTYTDATGHSWDSGKVTAEPTCTTEGVKTYTCPCSAQKTEPIPKAPHNYTSKVTPPTCTAKGYTMHTCSVCGDSYCDTYTNAAGHTWGEWETIQEPTETSTGISQRDCVNCSEYELKDIPKLDSGSGGGTGTPDTEDYGFCPKCGRRLWTSWYPSGCFTYLVDTVCECGVLVHAMECHHH